ncbi:MAG: hypothetical protein HY307_03090 [Arcobacter sp.]|nr:hypothetical protein [Arcobacter sp.]
MNNKMMNRKKLIVGLIILIVAIMLWPLIISTFVVKPKIEAQKELLKTYGMELLVAPKEGYFSSKSNFTLTVKDKDKFLPFLSSPAKVDKAILDSIFRETNDIAGLQFGGYVGTKIWQPFNVSVHISTNNLPTNQTKLSDYKDFIKTIGATFVFNLRGKLKEVDLDDLNLNKNELGLNLLLSFVKPVLKLSDTNQLSFLKYMITNTQFDKTIGLASNNPEYNFQYKNDYNFKFTATADDFSYYTKYNLQNAEDYTIYLAKKINENAKECENIRCIKKVANDILEDEKHIDRFEIFLDSRIIDGIKYNNASGDLFEIRQKDDSRNLEYRLTFTKDNFVVPNSEIKAGKNSSNMEMTSDKIALSIKTGTQINNLDLKRSDFSLSAKTAKIEAGLNNVKLIPIKYLMDNADQLTSWEEDGYSPLINHIIEVANYGGEMKYGMVFNDLQFSKIGFMIKDLKIDAKFVLAKNNYNILNKPAELMKYVSVGINVKIDKESFEKYVKHSLNEYKNLQKVAKYDGDTVILDFVFNIADDTVLANGKKLIK